MEILQCVGEEGKYLVVVISYRRSVTRKHDGIVNRELQNDSESKWN